MEKKRHGGLALMRRGIFYLLLYLLALLPLFIFFFLTAPLCLACSPRSMYPVLCLLSKKKFHDIRLLNSFVSSACSFSLLLSRFSPRLDHHLA